MYLPNYSTKLQSNNIRLIGKYLLSKNSVTIRLCSVVWCGDIKTTPHHTDHTTLYVTTPHHTILKKFKRKKCSVIPNFSK